jgi:hypothetical protein
MSCIVCLSVDVEKPRGRPVRPRCQTESGWFMRGCVSTKFPDPTGELVGLPWPCLDAGMVLGGGEVCLCLGES